MFSLGQAARDTVATARHQIDMAIHQLRSMVKLHGQLGPSTCGLETAVPEDLGYALLRLSQCLSDPPAPRSPSEFGSAFVFISVAALLSSNVTKLPPCGQVPAEWLLQWDQTCLRLFVSHRWLRYDQPDPEGLQLQLIRRALMTDPQVVAMRDNLDKVPAQPLCECASVLVFIVPAAADRNLVRLFLLSAGAQHPGGPPEGGEDPRVPVGLHLAVPGVGVSVCRSVADERQFRVITADHLESQQCKKGSVWLVADWLAPQMQRGPGACWRAQLRCPTPPTVSSCGASPTASRVPLSLTL